MAHDRLQSILPEGEALRYTAELRDGGVVGFTDERLLVVDDDPVSVEFEHVGGVSAMQIDWFVAVLSVALIGVAVPAGLENPLVGVGFATAGAVSLVLVYRKRGRVQVNVDGRSKPVEFHVESTDEFLERLEPRLEAYEQRLQEEYEAERSADERSGE